MAAPKTVLTYPLNGAQRDFVIPFEYLARKFIAVTLIGNTRRVLTLNSDYRFTARTTITTTKAWGPGDLFTSIELRRVTSATERLVDFADGSILRAYDLNTSQVQSLHIAEEARDLTADTIGVNNDGDLDARGRKIVNVADGVLDGDSVNMRQQKAWGGSALNQANIATQQAAGAAESAKLAGIHNYESKDAATRSDASRIQSENAQVNAQAARDKSKQWAESNDGVQVEPGMYSSKAWANTSQYHAGKSQASATASEQSRANSQASNVSSMAAAERSNADAARAKTEADKLGNANQFMGTLYKVTGNVPVWRDAGQFYGSIYMQRAGSPLSNQADAVRWTHLEDGRVILVDDPRGKVRLISDTAGNLYPQGNIESSGSITGADTVRAKATGDGNAHFWLRGKNNENRAIIYAGPNNVLRMSTGDGGNSLDVTPDGRTMPPGDIVFKVGGQATIQTDGNINSQIFMGGTLHQELSIYRAWRGIQYLKRELLAEGRFGTTGESIPLSRAVSDGEQMTFTYWNFNYSLQTVPVWRGETHVHTFGNGGVTTFTLAADGASVRINSYTNSQGILRIYSVNNRFA